MSSVSPYVIAMCRPSCGDIFDGGRVQREVLDRNVDHYCELIAQAAGEYGARIIVFPEFSLTGYAPVDDPVWNEAAFRFPGPETERISEAAKAAGAYVVIQVTEQHPAFPGRFFLSAALITPSGDISLVHRKSYAISLRTSPIDVFDRFVETFGTDSFFPVLDTELGRLGVLIGGEVHWPEAVRELALKGAELILNPMNSAPLIDYMGREGAVGVRSVRAFENQVYLGMANTPADGPAAGQIYDYDGAAIGHRVDAEGRFVIATIDVEALRMARTKPKANFLAQIQPSIHQDLKSYPLWPANSFAEAAAPSASTLYEVEARSWERLRAKQQTLLDPLQLGESAAVAPENQRVGATQHQEESADQALRDQRKRGGVTEHELHIASNQVRGN